MKSLLFQILIQLLKCRHALLKDACTSCVSPFLASPDHNRLCCPNLQGSKSRILKVVPYLALLSGELHQRGPFGSRPMLVIQSRWQKVVPSPTQALGTASRDSCARMRSCGREGLETQENLSTCKAFNRHFRSGVLNAMQCRSHTITRFAGILFRQKNENT